MQDDTSIKKAASEHLWLHFAPLPGNEGADLIVIERGEGLYVWDTSGNRYLDGLAGLFVTQVGHGRQEIVQAMAKQAETLAYYPMFGFVHPAGVALAERLAGLAPGDLNRVFFVSGGSEAIESAWKLARQYYLQIGQPERHKVIARKLSYHGTSLGALAITGHEAIRQPYLPMISNQTRHAANTNRLHCTMCAGQVACTLACADDIEAAILAEGPASVAAVVVEPVQNAGGCLTAPPAYFTRVREICDRYGVLMISDEVLTGFGRLGDWFGANRLGYQPDMIAFAKGATSGYAPLGGVLISDRIAEPFAAEGSTFLHGFTFGGHPVSCAAGLANLDLMEAEGLPARVRTFEDEFQAHLDTLRDLPIVADVRGMGYFWAVELTKGGEAFSAEESTWLTKQFLPKRMLELGLICRADNRGDPVIQLAPPLTAGPEEFAQMTAVIRQALVEAWRKIRRRRPRAA
ncbi:MAG: aspartate aminotransferase family protein [Actinomycetota bacterium]